MSLGGVFEHRQTVFVGDCNDGIHIGRASGEVYRDNHAGFARDGHGEEFRIEVAADGVNIHQHHFRSRVGDGRGGCYECVGCRDDFIAGTDSEGLEGQQEGIGAAVDAGAVFGFAIFGEIGFELIRGRAKDIGRAVEDFLYFGIDFVFD